jgi:hypothetical protein
MGAATGTEVRAGLIGVYGGKFEFAAMLAGAIWSTDPSEKMADMSVGGTAGSAVTSVPGCNTNGQGWVYSEG